MVATTFLFKKTASDASVYTLANFPRSGSRRNLKNPACWGQPQTLRNLGPTWPEAPALRLTGCVSFAIAPVPCFSPARSSRADNQCLLLPL